jgi:hypothetical protein
LLEDRAHAVDAAQSLVREPSQRPEFVSIGSQPQHATRWHGLGRQSDQFWVVAIERPRLTACGRECRWVDEDQIVSLTIFFGAGQKAHRVTGFKTPSFVGGVQLGATEIALRPGLHAKRSVDAGDRSGAAKGAGDAERSGVGEQVEHALARGETGQTAAMFAHVGEQAGVET